MIGIVAARFSVFARGSMDQVKIGMIGGGTVGSGVFHALEETRA